MWLDADDPLAVAATEAIHGGGVVALRGLLKANPGLAPARIIDRHGCGRTLLHVATDWPGHFPRVAETVAALVAAGADPDAQFEGGSTPRRRCTGPRAATTSRRSTRCSTPAPTSRRPAP